MANTKLVCSKCGGDKFVPGRSMMLLDLADGSIRRSWMSGEDDGAVLQCLTCQTITKWDSKAHRYVA